MDGAVAGRCLQGWPGSGGRGQGSESIGKDQESCWTGTGGVQLEKEAAPTSPAEQKCPGDTEVPAQSLASCYALSGWHPWFQKVEKPPEKVNLCSGLRSH